MLKKKKHQQGFYSQEVTRSDGVFLREVNNKRPKVFADAHGSSQSLLKRAFRYSTQVTVKPKFYSAELIAYESEVRKASNVLSYNCMQFSFRYCSYFNHMHLFLHFSVVLTVYDRTKLPVYSISIVLYIQA